MNEWYFEVGYLVGLAVGKNPDATPAEFKDALGEEFQAHFVFDPEVNMLTFAAPELTTFALALMKADGKGEHLE